ncbi:MAG: hypothetical protein GY769_12415 [bacterium]|nr:hypothetical protein [bacterium]
MIRKFGTVDAPVEVVRGLFANLESWPQWMPAVREVRVLERSETRALAEIDRTHGRRIHTTTFEFLFNPNGQRERQVAGIARKWESDWRFQVGPQDTGTLVSCRLELNMGLIGLLAPSRMIQRWIDRTFEKTLRGIREQARLSESEAALESGAPGEFHMPGIQVFATPTELEIWIGDRKYVAHAAD